MDFLLLQKEITEFIPLFLPKILIATICGLLIGIERELKQKVAGIRTNILICVGCTILSSLSFYLAQQYDLVDPTRMIGQIITGIGFLGAGVIMKMEDKIIGVTTAAFIWIASAIGIMIGSGFLITPVILTLGLLLISRTFEKIEVFIKNRIK
jgi:putative Mg2+ transporter-C (MgtC) family protein